MPILNIEFKASCKDITAAEAILQQHNPFFKGTDHQVDTYFNVPNGRLKLREGNIENPLIHYEREDTAGSKSSHVLLYQHQPDEILRCLSTTAFIPSAFVRTAFKFSSGWCWYSNT